MAPLRVDTAAALISPTLHEGQEQLLRRIGVVHNAWQGPRCTARRCRARRAGFLVFLR